MKKKVLDVTDQTCPLTFLKTKEFLKSNVDCEKTILIKGANDFKKLINSLSKNLFELDFTEKHINGLIFLNVFLKIE